MDILGALSFALLLAAQVAAVAVFSSIEFGHRAFLAEPPEFEPQSLADRPAGP